MSGGKGNYSMKEFLSSYIRRKFRSGKAEEVHEIARKYFGGDFPNPQRIGCPPKESFQKLIDEKGLPDEVLRSHLFGCSECFSDFQTALQQADFSKTPSKAVFQFNFKPLLAGGFIVVLITSGVLFWNWKSALNSSSIARGDDENVQSSANIAIENAETKAVIENQPKIGAENNSNIARQNSRTSRNTNEKQLLVKESDPKLLAKNEVEIDLNEPVWRDSANGASRKVIRLDAKEMRLRIKLPKENPAGVYEVFVVDEFGKTLTEKKKITVKNQTLSADFDLRKTGGKQRRLCFAPVGEIPDCILVNIGSTKKE